MYAACFAYTDDVYPIGQISKCSHLELDPYDVDVGREKKAQANPWNYDNIVSCIEMR